MPTAFFISSVGDTDLAKTTIERMRATGYLEEICIVPLTKTAYDRIHGFDCLNDTSTLLIGEELGLTGTCAEKMAQLITTI